MKQLFLTVILSMTALAPATADAAEYRAFWVDTFNTPLGNPADVVAVINKATAANTNAVFVQVRRRGDAWYLAGREPLPDFTPVAPGFDPLRELISRGHAAGLEVHAFVIVGAIWNKNPTLAPSATTGLPTDPNHVFNRHGGYDGATRRIVPGPQNWLTRTLLPDSGSISFQGHRFGPEFWIDLGHPDAARYTLEVLMDLVRNYEIDGLHLDRIRYPELDVSGQSPATGTNIGYNPTSVERFQRRHGGAEAPSPGDPLWMQWRRDQVTNFVRRVYLSAIAEKPHLKISAALIAFGGIGSGEAAWTSAEAYWRVYQDWRAWLEEGILDLAVPMNYKREHSASQAVLFDQWSEWIKNHQYRRASLIGIGAFLNAIEGTLRQTRRALTPSAAGERAAGVVFFSMANPDTDVAANPWSIPPGQATPQRGFDELASGLTTGGSRSGATLYEPLGHPPVFAEPASVPVLPWKSSDRGHLMGFARRPDQTAVDSGTVTIEEVVTKAKRITTTDGDGFFGFVDLEPGDYVVDVELAGEQYPLGRVTISAGAVARVPEASPSRRRSARRG